MEVYTQIATLGGSLSQRKRKKSSRQNPASERQGEITGGTDERGEVTGTGRQAHGYCPSHRARYRGGHGTDPDTRSPLPCWQDRQEGGQANEPYKAAGVSAVTQGKRKLEEGTPGGSHPGAG